jgi:deazaflavin-dependent oxidoreductase (nitroreductase family)
VARHVRPLAVVEHEGRRSGTRYRTPVMAFRSGETFTVALTYGRDVDWVRNVLAAGGCRIVYKGGSYTLADPRIGGAELSAPVPGWIRETLARLGVRDYLQMTAL